MNSGGKQLDTDLSEKLKRQLGLNDFGYEAQAVHVMSFSSPQPLRTSND